MQVIKKFILMFLSLHFFKTRALEIKIFSNLEAQKDRAFFKSDFRKFIHNFGHLTEFKFYFVDRGLLVGPRLCVLEQVEKNPYLQATYLDCEVRGKSFHTCRKFILIDRNKYTHCLESLAVTQKRADREIGRANVQLEDLPVAVLPTVGTIKSLTHDKLRQAFCISFKDELPVACQTKRGNKEHLPAAVNMLDIIALDSNDNEESTYTKNTKIAKTDGNNSKRNDNNSKFIRSKIGNMNQNHEETEDDNVNAEEVSSLETYHEIKDGI